MVIIRVHLGIENKRRDSPEDTTYERRRYPCPRSVGGGPSLVSGWGSVCGVPGPEQSGVGASLTLHAPVKARSLEIPALGRLSAAANEEAASDEDQQAEVRNRVTAFSVEGTPGDSCILALEKLVGSVDLCGLRHQLRVQSGLGRDGVRVRWARLSRATSGAIPRLQYR